MADLFSNPVSVRQALRVLTETLAGIYPKEEAKAIAWQLLERVLQAGRAQLLTCQEAPLSAAQAALLTTLTGRLLHHEPLQYVLGFAEFCGLTLHVAPGVLIPRPETEELAFYIINQNKNRQNLKVLDIGTGSGCLALALKSGLTGAEVHAIDISEDALRIAKSNALQTNLEVEFHKADILNPKTETLPTGFDIIVSNPPYVLQSEEDEMLPNVLDFEPHSALFVPDSDPLLFYKAIAVFAKTALLPTGQLFLETHHRFAPDIAKMLQEQDFSNVKVMEDMFGKPRFVTACAQYK